MLKLSPTVFRSVPDPSLLYLTDQHARALAFLQLSIRKAGCLTTLISDNGCGRTLLVSAAINDADDDLTVIQLDGDGLGDDQLLRETLTQLQPASPGAASQLPGLASVRAALAGDRGRVLFVITNAQMLDESIFQCLQAMARPEKGRRRRISLVLTGGHGLETLLYTIGRNVLDDWNMMMAQLPPLGLSDVTGYVQHRLQLSGQTAEVFEPESFEVIHRLSGGIPERINALCDKAAQITAHSKADLVAPGQVRAAAKELGWRGAEADGVIGLSAATVKPSLELSQDGEVLGIFTLDQERTLIGRDADNEITVDSPYVSRHHSLIVRDELGFWITDINSTNGTFLNGERVLSQLRLSPGDHIRVGRHELKINIPGQAPGPLSGIARLHDGMADTMVDPQDREDPADGLQRVDAALADEPDRLELQFERACFLSDLGRKDEAIGVFDQLARQQAAIPEVHNNLAVLLAERGELLRARAELEKAIRLAPDYACAHENLADIYLQLAAASCEIAAEQGGENKEQWQRKLTSIRRLQRP